MDAMDFRAVSNLQLLSKDNFVWNMSSKSRQKEFFFFW
jgi:hypothetical protein